MTPEENITGQKPGDEPNSVAAGTVTPATPTTYVDEGDLTIEEQVERDFAPFILDADKFTVPVRESGSEYLYTVTRPTRPVEERLALMSKIITVQKSRREGDEQVTEVTTKNDTGRARLRYFDTIGLTVSGFDFDDDGQPEENLDVRQVVEGLDAEYEEEVRARHFLQPKKKGDAPPPILVLHLLPDLHKLRVADDLFGGTFTIVRPKGKVVRSLRGRRTIKVRQEIGGGLDDEGQKQQPRHVVIWEFAEPSGEQFTFWEANGFNSSTIVHSNGDNEEHRTVSLDTYCGLFDGNEAKHQKGILRVTGAKFGDGTDVDVTNPKHLARIPDALKKTVVMFVFNHVKRETGN